MDAEGRGLQGLVIDGSIRDGGLIAVLGFPVFHAGFAPATSVKELAPSVGEPVEVGGVTVTPGDQIVADSDAVLVVPAADWPAVEAAALRDPGPRGRPAHPPAQGRAARRPARAARVSATATAADARVGVDVGGTFTDVILQGGDGRVLVRKLLSTPPSYDRAVVEAVGALAADDNGSVAEVIHGTTVATNAVLERRGSPTALVTTAGFRDVLELRRLRIPHMYDLFWRKPPPLVERSLRFELDERVTADGTVLRPLDESECRVLAGRLRETGVESVAVCFLHSYLYPDHEERLGAILAEELPEATISLSSRILREQREYERSATTVVNAYVRPLMASYIDRIRTGLDGIGLDGPAADHAVLRRRDDLRRREAAAGLRARVRPRRGRGRRARSRGAARAPERDRVRHGRHDRQGLADRGRRDLARPRVRGRRLDVGRQPADPRRRRAAAHPDDRHRRGGCGRRQHRLDRPRRRAAGRAAQRGRRPRPCLLRPWRHRADRHRRERRARVHPAGHGRGRPDHDLGRARRGGGPARGGAARARPAHRGGRDPPDRERADDACAALGLLGEGPRPARLRDRRVRRLGPDPCGRARGGSRRRHGRRARRRGALQRRRPAVRPSGVPRGADVPPRRRHVRPERGRGALRRDGGAARARARRPRRRRAPPERRPALRRPELGGGGRARRRPGRPRRAGRVAGAVRGRARAPVRRARPARLAGRDPRAAAHGARRPGGSRAPSMSTAAARPAPP